MSEGDENQGTTPTGEKIRDFLKRTESAADSMLFFSSRKQPRTVRNFRYATTALAPLIPVIGDGITKNANSLQTAEIAAGLTFGTMATIEGVALATATACGGINAGAKWLSEDHEYKVMGHPLKVDNSWIRNLNHETNFLGCINLKALNGLE